MSAGSFFICVKFFQIEKIEESAKIILGNQSSKGLEVWIFWYTSTLQMVRLKFVCFVTTTVTITCTDVLHNGCKAKIDCMSALANPASPPTIFTFRTQINLQCHHLGSTLFHSLLFRVGLSPESALFVSNGVNFKTAWPNLVIHFFKNNNGLLSIPDLKDH